jgi:hypothetical protein
MTDYLKEETAFIRGLQWRFLLILFLAAMTRSGALSGAEIGVVGVSIDINQGLIIVAGPILCLLLQLGSRAEGRNLKFVRQQVTTKVTEPRRETQLHSWTTYGMIYFPTLAVVFFIVQYTSNLVPADVGCSFAEWRHFFDFSLGGRSSMFCIGDQTKDMPWIYSPYQTWFYVALAVLSALIGRIMQRDWQDSRFEQP